MAPVLRAIAGSGALRQQLVLTGQHAGLARCFDAFPPGTVQELRCDLTERSDKQLRACVRKALCGYLREDPADLVLVQGDTTSALAGALAACDCGIPVGHVEAGLRSFDLRQPWPEEGNRVAIDSLSSILFAPTADAAQNLSADPRVRGDVYVTGNTGIDALFDVLEPTKRLSNEARQRNPRTILVTCHRKENAGAAVHSICAAVRRLVRALPVEVVFPLHPNRHVRRSIEALLGGEPKIALAEPLGHREMVRLIDRSWLILTDSGGLQEEGPALGVPVLVLRNVTERGEAIQSRNIELVGTGEDAIVEAVTALFVDPARYARMSRPSLPFGDGRAAARIVGAIEQWLGGARSAVA